MIGYPNGRKPLELDPVDVAYQQGRHDEIARLLPRFKAMRAWSIVWCALAVTGWLFALWLLGRSVLHS